MDRVVRADPTRARDYGTTEKPIKAVRIYKNKVPPAASCLNDFREVDTGTIKKVAAAVFERSRQILMPSSVYTARMAIAHRKKQAHLADWGSRSGPFVPIVRMARRRTQIYMPPSHLF
jgi:hypothetical protein